MFINRHFFFIGLRQSFVSLDQKYTTSFYVRQGEFLTEQKNGIHDFEHSGTYKCTRKNVRFKMYSNKFHFKIFKVQTEFIFYFSDKETDFGGNVLVGLEFGGFRKPAMYPYIQARWTFLEGKEYFSLLGGINFILR